MPDVPALVLAGSSDLVRPVETAQRTVARFPRGKLLVASYASPDDDCAALAVVRFMHGERVQDRCPRTEPLVAVADPTPTSLRDVPAFRGVPGRRGRLLSAFAASFGDLVDDFFATFFANPNAILHGRKIRGGGLRGGRYLLGEEILELRHYEFVPGVRISGRWLTGDDRRRGRPLRIDGPGRLDGRVWLREDFEEDLLLHVRGRIAGRRVRVRMKVASRLLDAIEGSVDGETVPAAAALPLLR